MMMEEILKSIFRPLPPRTNGEPLPKNKRKRAEEKILDFHPDVKQPLADPAWPEIQLAYDSLFEIVTSDEFEPLFIEGIVDESNFVQKLLDNLLDSDDAREAKAIGKLLPEIWSRFVCLQRALWTGVEQTVSRFLADSKNHLGSAIRELLMFLSERIKELPLAPLFLLRLLIRLHKPSCLAEYNQPLTLCITKILEEDESLAEDVILGILRHWPTKFPLKEALMLREIRDILLHVPETEIVRSADPIFRRLDSCLRSEHYLVVTRALEILDLPAFRLIAKRSNILISLFSSGIEVAAEHWKLTVANKATDIRRTYRQIENQGGKQKASNELFPGSKITHWSAPFVPGVF